MYMCIEEKQRVCQDHYLVEARVLVAKEWCSRAVRSRREVVKIEELRKPEKMKEYQERVKAAHEGVKDQAVR